MSPPKDYSRLGGYLLFVHVLLVVQISLGALYLASCIPSVLRAGGWVSPTPRWYGWLNLAAIAAALALGVAALVFLRKKKKPAFAACYAARLCVGMAGSALGLVEAYLYRESILAFVQERYRESILALAQEGIRQGFLREQMLNGDEYVQAYVRIVMGISCAVLSFPLLVNAGCLIAWLAYSRRSKRAAAYFDPAYRPPAWFGYAPLGVAPYGAPVRAGLWPPPGAQHPYPPPGAQYYYPPQGYPAPPPAVPTAPGNGEETRSGPQDGPGAPGADEPPSAADSGGG